MGEANAAIPTVQPSYLKPMWGMKAGSAARNSVAFVSKLSISSGTIDTYGLSKTVEAVRDCRGLKKSSMKWNSAIPKMAVDAESFEVYADDVLQDIQAADRVPLGRLYNLF